jgi:tetratricopeptide (TPR) repeat protein
MKTLATVAMVIAAAVAVPAARQQDALEEAKAQYAAASYEDALTTLTKATSVPPASRVEVEQYRAFCLIALGRLTDAERAVAALVEADPKYTPSANVASPRVLSLLADMRKKELPGVARRLLDSGRAAYKERDFGRAQHNLKLLLQLLDEPSMKGRPDTEDLRVLAEGFAALADASAAPPAPVVSNAASPRNDPSPSPSTSSAAMLQADTVTEPVPVKQDVPVWVPPNSDAGAREFIGAIRVRIGADGLVKSAVMERATYPSYDARLIQASRTWLYKPATRNGQPVEAERVIPIQLRPRR